MFKQSLPGYEDFLLLFYFMYVLNNILFSFYSLNFTLQFTILFCNGPVHTAAATFLLIIYTLYVFTLLIFTHFL